MGLFSSSKRTTTQTTNLTTTTPTATGTQGSQTLAAGKNIKILDENAIEKSLDFARVAYEKANNSFSDVVNQTYDFAKYGMAAAKDQGEMMSLAYQAASGKATPINYGQLASMGLILVGVVVFLKRRKG